MKSFNDYEELQNEFIRIVAPLAMMQEEIAPELFAPLADAFLKELKLSKKLYGVEHNSDHQQREAKYRYKLLRKGWKCRLREELGKMTWLDRMRNKMRSKRHKSEFEIVKVAVESEQSERINSAAVYAPPSLDNGEERKQLPDQCETDKASHCLAAPPSEAQPGQTEVDIKASPVDLCPGAEDEE